PRHGDCLSYGLWRQCPDGRRRLRISSRQHVWYGGIFSYGAFWWSFALFAHYFGTTVPATFVGWYLFVWGVFTFYMWIATFKTTMALQLVFLALWVTFILLALGAWGLTFMTTVGGYAGLITAILAFYLSAAEVINESFGRTALPIGPFVKPSTKTLS
ncbi:MAG: acetate uptake transporter, partial [Sulfobacillus sp.]